MINMEDESQIIPKGVELGILREAEVIEIPDGMELERDEDERESENEEVPRVSLSLIHI